MTKNELRQYKHLKSEINQLENILNELRDIKDNNLASSVLNDLPRSTGISDPTAKSAILNVEIHEVCELLLLKQSEKIKLLGKIEDTISVLSPKERIVIRSYYIQGDSWEQVAVDMHYSIQRIWQIHGDILDKISHL